MLKLPVRRPQRQWIESLSFLDTLDCPFPVHGLYPSARSWSSSAKQQQDEEPVWVPKAYRGNYRSSSKKRPPPTRRPRPSSNNKEAPSYLSPDSFRERRQHAKLQRSLRDWSSRILNSHINLLGLVAKYRNIIKAETVDLKPPTPPLKIDNKSMVQKILKQRKTALRDLHAVDVSWEGIHESEDLFRAICRTLQDLAVEATKFTSHVDTDLAADDCLKDLVWLQSERRLLVERRLNATQYPSDGKSNDDSASPMKNWVSSLMGKAADPSNSTAYRTFAHQDKSAGVTQSIFSSVIQNLPARLNNDPTDAQISDTASRMVQLLQAMPADFTAKVETTRFIMEWQQKVGTLASARMVQDIFARHHDRKHRLRFDLVLMAYLEAVRRQSNKKERLEIVEESIGVLRNHWKEQYPSHRNERISNTAAVLHCMALHYMQQRGNCDTESWRPVYETADALIKEALDKPDYDYVQSLILDTDGPTDDLQRQHLAPLLNYLILLYALMPSGVPVATRLMDYILELQPDSISFGRKSHKNAVVPYPTTEAFDAVIEGTTGIIQHQSKKERDEVELLASLDYCTNLVRFMYLQDKPHCRPGAKTMDWMFLLLRAINPRDIGTRGQDLLDMLQVCQITRENESVMRLKHYHHALVCWQLAATSHGSSAACQKALEILTMMEMQSIPLILNDRELHLLSVDLYKPQLRPTNRTYRIVLDVCFDSIDAKEATRVATLVYRRMLANEIDVDATKRALELSSRLELGSQERKDFETLVLSTLKDE